MIFLQIHTSQFYYEFLHPEVLYHKFLLLEQLFLTTLMKPATKFEETKDIYSTGYQSIKTELYKNTSLNLNQKLAMLAKSMFSIP